ncbi:GntR family transcriptional regulator [Pseudarthrobacter sp. NamE5]|uniref:GntR family transcriptional regulator n=1 Tax=Pseudarthrobacter sp. NamE5 TaxID=2576839 RepID=UPI00110B1BF3|nr:GntR family transcriptional regulator [Pseudarthrobacter sp. NamE5]TLM82485.1 GntR family transcriptional regulator [Pseudarthrobacter sp. NamE5]
MATALTWNDSAGEAVRTQSFREQAVRIIRSQIVSGRLEPGSLHSIGAVAERLNVSITPVREALHDLAKEGLIEMKRNRGFLVRQPTGKELDDIVQIRSMIEVSAVREITEKSLITDFGPVRQLCRRTDAFAAAGQWEEFVDADREFHLTLLGALGNPKLLELVGSLRDQSRLLGLGRLAGSDLFLKSTKEHELLLNAMEAGDAEGAADIMSSHMRHVRGIWAGQDEEPGQD